MKIVMMCDADTHFLCNAIPYLGRGTVDTSRYNSHGEFYIMELTAPYPRHGRVVTTGNWFSTLKGAEALQKNGLDFIGTIKDKPYLPKILNTMKIEVGKSVALYNYEKNITLICHQAKSKKVQLLTTIHHKPSVMEKSKTDIQMFYNAAKGGVDTFDQLCANTSCIRGTRRWPMCFFYNIVNLAYTNSYILHQVQCKGGITFTRKAFGLKLAEHLTRLWALSRLQQKTMHRDVRFLIGLVFNVNSDIPIDDVEGEGPKKRNRCHMCPRASNKKSRVTCVRCKKTTCPDHYNVVCKKCSTD